MAFRMPKGVNLSGFKGINFGDPTVGTDAANKQYVDSVARGLDWKHEVVAASTGNVNVASPGASMDGIALSAGMQTFPDLGTVTRVLLKDQTDATQNGVYDWNGATSALTRSADSASGAQISGSTYTVQRGTVNADRVYHVVTDDTITVGTTAIAFAQVGGASAPYTADPNGGLQLVGQAFSVLLQTGSGLVASSTGLKVDRSQFWSKFAQDCVATTNPQDFTITGMGTDALVQVFEGGVQIQPDVTLSAGKVTVDYGVAPSAASYRVLAGY